MCLDQTKDFFEREIEARKIADKNVSLEQSKLKPGDFCVRYVRGIAIYSEILDAADLLLRGKSIEDLDEEERMEYESVKNSYQDPFMQNYRFTRSFSYLCPNGELGDIHISTVSSPISRSDFLTAKNNGWREIKA